MLTKACAAGLVSIWYEAGDMGYAKGWYWALHTEGSKSSFQHKPIGPFSSKSEAYDSARLTHKDLPTWKQLRKVGAV